MHLQMDEKMGTLPKVVVTTSWDDGHPLDLKLADLLMQYGVKGTFYIATANMEREAMDASAIRELSRRWEIGGHTRTHPNLTQLNQTELDEEIRGGKLDLEDIIGEPLTMFCYPGGYYNWRVRRAVVSSGFIGARCCKRFHLCPGEDPLLMLTTVAVYPHTMWLQRTGHLVWSKNWRGLNQFAKMGFPNSWVQIAIRLFQIVRATGGVWHFWGHSWEIEENNLWAKLREVLTVVGGWQDIAYMTNGEVMANIVSTKE